MDSDCWLFLPPELAQSFSCQKLEVFLSLLIFLMLFTGIMFLFDEFDLCRWVKRSTGFPLPAGFLRPTRACSTLWRCWYGSHLVASLISVVFLLWPSLLLWFATMTVWEISNLLRDALFSQPPKNYEELPSWPKR